MSTPLSLITGIRTFNIKLGVMDRKWHKSTLLSMRKLTRWRIVAKREKGSECLRISTRSLSSGLLPRVQNSKEQNILRDSSNSSQESTLRCRRKRKSRAGRRPKKISGRKPNGYSRTSTPKSIASRRENGRNNSSEETPSSSTSTNTVSYTHLTLPTTPYV